MVISPMIQIKKFVGRLAIPALSLLIPFRWYLMTFDGAYSKMDFSSGVVVSIALGVAIFMYEPIAKKIERFSMAWFLVLLISVSLFVGGWIIADPYFLRLPLTHRAWGEYMLAFGFLIPIIHFIFNYVGKPREKESFFKRIRLKPTDNAHV